MLFCLLHACIGSLSAQSLPALGDHMAAPPHTGGRSVYTYFGIEQFKELSVDGIVYWLTASKQNKVHYISTRDKNFKAGHLQVGQPLAALKQQQADFSVEHRLGWGYYIKLENGWYAAFDWKNPPNDAAKINYFFRM